MASLLALSAASSSSQSRTVSTGSANTIALLRLDDFEEEEDWLADDVGADNPAELFCSRCNETGDEGEGGEEEFDI